MPLPPAPLSSEFLSAASSSRKVRSLHSALHFLPPDRDAESPTDVRFKRSHADITRSQSRSATPDLPSKRRRIRSIITPSSSLFTSTSAHPPPVTRSPRAGFDYRRPVMSTRNEQRPQGSNSLTIDLTADSDQSTGSESPPRPPPLRIARPRSVGHSNTRAPPFVGRRQQETHVVIDSSDSDFEIEEFEVESDTESDEAGHSLSSSPDVQILHSRPAPSNNNHPQPMRPPNRQPSPTSAERGGVFQHFPDIIRRGTRYMLGNAYNDESSLQLEMLRARANDESSLQLDMLRARADGFRQLRQERAAQENSPRRTFVIDLDYRHAAFPLDGVDMFERSSETPQVVQEPYKAPKPSKKGFLRTFAESDVVLCPRCGDELATGKDDTKQQVWVVKQCGHVRSMKLFILESC